jgi:hypothetical protein
MGGLIIASLGFNWLYGLAIGLVILSGLPMFFDKFVKKNMRFNIRKILTSFWQAENINFTLAFLGSGFKDMVLNVAWPIFMFLIIKQYQTIGAIQTIAFLFTLMLLWRLGKQIDKGGVGIFKWGIAANSLIWMIRSFLLSPILIFLSNIIYGFGTLLIWTPFDAHMYKTLLKKRRLEFLILREAVIHFGGLLSSLLVLVFIKLSLGWYFIFSMAALGLILINLVFSKEVRNG